MGWLDADNAEERRRLQEAIAEHHRQKADDRCREDDDKLYAAAGLPPVDRRVGDKAAMLANCARFIERRCEGGGWPSYAELEKQIADYRLVIMAMVGFDGVKTVYDTDLHAIGPSDTLHSLHDPENMLTELWLTR